MTEEKKPSVRYVLKIETTFEGSGDYMGNATIPEFFKWANEEAQYINVFLSRGSGTEPKQVRAKITVDSVSLIPRT